MERVTFNGMPLEPGPAYEFTHAVTGERGEIVPLPPRRFDGLRYRVQMLRERLALRVAPWLDPFD